MPIMLSDKKYKKSFVASLKKKKKIIFLTTVLGKWEFRYDLFSAYSLHLINLIH